MANVAQRIIEAVTPKSARTRIEAAHTVAVVAHQEAVGKRQRAAYEATINPDAAPALEKANRELADAQRQLQVTTEALAELGVVEAKNEAARQLAAERAVDRQALQACDRAVAAARELEKAIGSYADAYRKFVVASEAASLALISTPRAREDVRTIATDTLVPDEIARASHANEFGQGLIPGANKARALVAGNTDWPGLAAEVEGRASAATAGLRR